MFDLVILTDVKVIELERQLEMKKALYEVEKGRARDCQAQSGGGVGYDTLLIIVMGLLSIVYLGRASPLGGNLVRFHYFLEIC
ncbi:hypothetical protein ONS95_003540 [Cadophora gregata]|uniref:uncharacterized protein n=1 Tax=Cadophora gregata TaxID=51156 RepID=UPI0026DCD9A6|nr:uncharacterized protein ONS95_003540 [Cadophora gregata]KAK0099386.1 hypothetical protein ONS96_008415 [Cadophora gregata f. sp. sojae]KAK0106819.1 hypothetical protein ONS95_003540 [Cadophora gregata]